MRELERAELVLHAGDFVAASVLDDLEAYAPVEAVFGNMDERAVIERLPEEHVVEMGETRIGMVHIPGPRLGREERLVRRFPGCAGVVYGHTHIPQVTRHDGIWILNPGSPTERRRAAARSLLVLDVDGGRIEPRLVELR